MLIIILGPSKAGKNVLADYLSKSYGFDRAYLCDSPNLKERRFLSPAEYLDWSTINWGTDTVTTEITNVEYLAMFKKRTFVLVVALDAPIKLRYIRSVEEMKQKGQVPLGLEKFIELDDFASWEAPETSWNGPLKKSFSFADIYLTNPHSTIEQFVSSIEALKPPLTDPLRLRPNWDIYFMALAELASRRSNCIKRRVGAILVKSNRVIATGYNGTPRGLPNCNEGGCPRCNSFTRGRTEASSDLHVPPTKMIRSGAQLDMCLCLHGEENVLLESGRNAMEGILYCNTFPCLGCAVKLVQAGIREVIFSQPYSMDEAAGKVLEMGGVKLRRLHENGHARSISNIPSYAMDPTGK